MSDSILIDVARYRVLFADCDPMRIMYNGTYFRLFGIGWTELLRRFGEPLGSYIARGLFPVVVEAKCRYLKPARYDDDLIIRCGLTLVGAVRFELRHEVARLGDEVLARGVTVHVMVNDQNRPQRVPAEIKHAAEVIQARLVEP
jgi:acyl-CoA thioester hydrolase